MIKNPNLHVRRFEFKYLISNRQLDPIRKSISNFVVADPFAREAKGGIYPVSSLYFDNFGFFSYYEKIDGIKNRKKFRIRSYEKKLSSYSNVFVEIKKRDEVIIFKDRSCVPIRNVIHALELGEYDELLNAGEKDVSAQFLYYFIRKSLKPVVLVTYNREAYFDSRNYSFRLTLDQNLRAQRSPNIDFKQGDSDEILPGYSLLEAKFNRIMPAWFGEIIKQHNLNRISFSKYCYSLEACGIVRRTDLSILP